MKLQEQSTILSDFARTRAELPKARHLPGDVYASPARLAAEKDRIFMTHWLMVGREEEIPQVGDYMTRKVLDEPIVISRSKDDGIVAFMNMCLHRGVEVATGCGHAKHFVCPYHAWLYDSGGNFVAAEQMSKTEYDPKSARLHRLHLELWRGWIFVNFSPDPVAFADFIRPYEDELWWFRTDECVAPEKIVIDVQCNWKLLVENLIDIYHVSIVHKSSFGKNLKSNKDELSFKLLPEGGWSYEQESRPHSKTGQQMFPTLPWVEGKGIGVSYKAGIYPNLNLSLRADSMRMWQLWPLSPDTTRLEVYLLFPPETLKEPDYEKNMVEYREFVRTIVSEDAVMVESLQAAASSRFFVPGPLSHLEGAINHMQKHYLDVMGL